MEVVRCENGHFYDRSRFSECPHCNPTSANNATMPLTSNGPAQGAVPEEDTDGKTVAYYDWVGDKVEEPKVVKTSAPVVGWVVVVEGAGKGGCFTLKAGRNFIGRSLEMDIRLEDKTISRDRHAVLVFEPKSNTFLVTPGEARELFYLNGDVVLSAQQIKAYDVISLGKTNLMFIPFCGDKFSWDAAQKPASEDKE